MAIITGTSSGETLTGTARADTITGGPGNDIALMGAGSDRFVWNPGDGSDAVDGQAGTDTLAFNGSNINEHFQIFASGTHAELTRDVANITMDLNRMERIELHTLGGADNITIGDLTGTAVKQVAIDLGASGGGGDGQVDTVAAVGGNAANHVNVTFSAGMVTVSGLAETLTLANAEGSDALVINGLGGNDTINAAKLAAGLAGLTLDGGSGNDLIFGSAGADILLGGDGNDTVTGGRGSDTALLGDGNDRFNWNLGDGSDTIEGQTGLDALHLIGGTGGDSFDISANGARTRIAASDGSVLDVNGVENIAVQGGHGGDTIVIHDLAGTSVTGVTVDLTGAKGGNVVVDGALGANMSIATVAGSAVVTNQVTFQSVAIQHAHATDLITVNGSNDADVINAAQLAATGAHLQINGGVGADVIIGSAGGDIIVGGRDNDTALMGAGNDRYVWNPGDGSDSVDGQAGTDTLAFNGANINEHLDILANGQQSGLTRDVANITMNLNSIERIELQALGGADTIHVHDLTGTAVKQVAIDLGTNVGAPDGAIDALSLDGGSGHDNVHVSSRAGGISVTGLAAGVTITHGDATDTLTINGNNGDDTLNASGFQAGAGQLTLDGGAGKDTITGGHGDDVLIGGVGNDVITGGGGADTIDYNSTLDGHDVVTDFKGGQDALNLDALFDSLGVAAADRAGRVSIIDHGKTVDVAVDADGNGGNGFEITVATLHTVDPISVGHEVLVGT